MLIFKTYFKKLFYYDRTDFIVDKSRVYKTGYLLILNSQWGEENLGLGRDEKKTFEIYCKIESDREGKILQLYVEGKKKCWKWTYLQNTNRVTDVESKLMVTKGNSRKG